MITVAFTMTLVVCRDFLLSPSFCVKAVKISVMYVKLCCGKETALCRHKIQHVLKLTVELRDSTCDSMALVKFNLIKSREGDV